jgi:hypothetical protein
LKIRQNFFAPEALLLKPPVTPGQKFFGSFLQKRTAISYAIKHN